jgi:hypothetical protein
MRKYDPYHDIPLNTDPPKPVIELPGGDAQAPSDALNGEHADLFGNPVPVNLLGEPDLGTACRKRGRGH